MARQLLIQITSAHPEVDTRVSWLVLDNHQVEGDVVQGTLAEAAIAAAGARVLIIVPAERVYLTRQHLPSKNRQRLLKAIPFALEDQIIDDVESMHFALGPGDAQGRYWIAAVARTQMDEWQDVLRQAGLNPEIDEIDGQLRLRQRG
ncbi:MAG: type II secretion system protein GspL, partial [Gammaproteobacteria bacterium]